MGSWGMGAGERAGVVEVGPDNGRGDWGREGWNQNQVNQHQVLSIRCVFLDEALLSFPPEPPSPPLSNVQ